MIWAIKNNERIEATPKETATCPICNEEVISKCGVVKKWHWAHKNKEDCDEWYEPESEWHIYWKNEFPKEQQEVKIENHRADIKVKNLVIELQSSSITPDSICDRETFYKNMIWLLNGETLGKGLKINDKTSYFTFSWKNPPQSWFYSDKPIYIDLNYFVNDLKDSIDDLGIKINIIFNELKNLVGDPHKFDFYLLESKSYSESQSKEKIERKNILNLEKEWTKLSWEFEDLKDKKEIFEENKTILFIKKLYKKIPCGGWGYLITKEDFLRGYKDGEEKNN